MFSTDDPLCGADRQQVARTNEKPKGILKHALFEAEERRQNEAQMNNEH